MSYIIRVVQGESNPRNRLIYCHLIRSLIDQKNLSIGGGFEKCRFDEVSLSDRWEGMKLDELDQSENFLFYPFSSEFFTHLKVPLQSTSIFQLDFVYFASFQSAFFFSLHQYKEISTYSIISQQIWLDFGQIWQNIIWFLQTWHLISIQWGLIWWVGGRFHSPPPEVVGLNPNWA